MMPERTRPLNASKMGLLKGAYDSRDLMAKVASYLDINDLRSLAKTCRTWRNAVTREMHFRCPQRILVYEQENEFVLQNFINASLHMVVLFVKHDFKRKVRREQMLCQQFMYKFPKNLITISFDDAFTEANVINVDLPLYDEKRNFVYFKNSEVPGLLIPYHHTVEIKTLRLTLKQIKTDYCVPTMFSSLEPKKSHLKSIIILFTYGINQNIYLDMMMRSLDKYFRKDNCTLWGAEIFHPPCIHDSQQNDLINSDAIGLVVLSITNPNLESYSFVLDIADIETSYAYESICKFKNGIRLKNNSIGFLIGPEFEDFQMDSDDEESDAQADKDADDFYRMNYEKRLMYYLKKLFPRVYFNFLFQDNILRVFGISQIEGQYKFHHEKSITLMIMTYD